jgi:hypothetical protein
MLAIRRLAIGQVEAALGSGERLGRHCEHFQTRNSENRLPLLSRLCRRRCWSALCLTSHFEADRQRRRPLLPRLEQLLPSPTSKAHLLRYMGLMSPQPKMRTPALRNPDRKGSRRQRQRQKMIAPPSCGTAFVTATRKQKSLSPSCTCKGLPWNAVVNRHTSCCWQHRGSGARQPIVSWQAPMRSSANEDLRDPQRGTSWLHLLPQSGLSAIAVPMPVAADDSRWSCSRPPSSRSKKDFG